MTVISRSRLSSVTVGSDLGDPLVFVFAFAFSCFSSIFLRVCLVFSRRFSSFRAFFFSSLEDFFSLLEDVELLEDEELFWGFLLLWWFWGPLFFFSPLWFGILQFFCLHRFKLRDIPVITRDEGKVCLFGILDFLLSSDLLSSDLLSSLDVEGLGVPPEWGIGNLEKTQNGHRAWQQSYNQWLFFVLCMNLSQWCFQV